MTKFSHLQKAKCVLWLAESHDIETVQMNFKEEFVYNELVARVPAVSEILQWYDNFDRTGKFDLEDNFESNGKIGNEIKETIEKEKTSYDIHSVDYEKGSDVLNFFGIRKMHKRHSYKMHLFDSIKMEDWVNRKNFAQFQLDHIPTHDINQLWFGGEAIFYTNGRVECHNILYLNEDPEKPDSKIAPPRAGSHVTVWAGINSEGLIGPYMVLGETNQQAYKLFLRKFFYELHQQYRYKHIRKPLFIQDDAILHEYAKDFLDVEFPNHWIGPGSDYGEWPRLSADINPLCFFLWGHIKSQIYEFPMQSDDLSELEFRIHQAFTTITPDMLKQVWDDYMDRLRIVLETNGSLVDAHNDYENKSIQNE